MLIYHLSLFVFFPAPFLLKLTDTSLASLIDRSMDLPCSRLVLYAAYRFTSSATLPMNSKHSKTVETSSLGDNFPILPSESFSNLFAKSLAYSFCVSTNVYPVAPPLSMNSLNIACSLSEISISPLLYLYRLRPKLRSPNNARLWFPEKSLKYLKFSVTNTELLA